MKNTYLRNKEKVRNEAINWQYDFSKKITYLSEIAEKTTYFMRLAKRYGLIKEFKREGII